MKTSELQKDDLVRMIFVEGLKIKEASELIGVKLSTAKSIIK